MPRSMPAWSAVVVAVAMASVTAFAFGQRAAPPAGEELRTLPPVVVSATGNDWARASGISRVAPR